MSNFCDCPCHEPGSDMMHCMPCCEGWCPKCNRYIRNFLKAHTENCDYFENPKKLYEDFLAVQKENLKLKGVVAFLTKVNQDLIDDKKYKVKK